MAAVKSKSGTKTKKKVQKRPSKLRKNLNIKCEPVPAHDVHLIEGTGSSKHGGGPGGRYWHIYVVEKRAGYTFINLIKDEFFGEHPSIQIFLNQSARGRQIGRVAYRLACEQSGYNTVYAHMRKSNIASIRAAEEAGFSVVERNDLPQRTMIWQRRKSSSKDELPKKK